MCMCTHTVMLKKNLFYVEESQAERPKSHNYRVPELRSLVLLTQFRVFFNNRFPKIVPNIGAIKWDNVLYAVSPVPENISAK